MRTIKTWFAGVTLAAVVSATSLAAGIPGAPAPFDKDGMKLALVSYISVGDYFQAYEAGVAAQAKAAGIELHIFQGKENAAEMREQIEQAISLGVNGILIDHGPPEAVKDVIQEALDKGIKVVLKETTDAYAIGEVSLRALALLVAGQDPGHVIEAKPVLITQDYLNKRVSRLFLKNNTLFQTAWQEIVDFS